MFNVTTIFWVRSRTQGKSNNNNNMSTHKGYTKRHRQAKIFLMLFVGSLFCLLFEMMLNADLGEKRERKKCGVNTQKKSCIPLSLLLMIYTEDDDFFSVSRTIFFLYTYISCRLEGGQKALQKCKKYQNNERKW